MKEQSVSTAKVTEEWTAKDALAHMIHWAGQIAFGMGAPLETPAWVVGETGRPSDDEWNRRERINQRTNDQMNATDAIPWGGDRPLWKQIASETYAHWPGHSANIERAAKAGV